jgi:hypothetical protein
MAVPNVTTNIIRNARPSVRALYEIKSPYPTGVAGESGGIVSVDNLSSEGL